MVELAPWPGQMMVSGEKFRNIRSSIEWMMVGKSPPSKVALPGPPGKSVSPVKSMGVFSRAKEI